MSRYAAIVVRLRFLVVALWLAAVVAAHVYLPDIEDQQGAPLTGLVASDSPALAAELRAAELFDVPVLTRTVVVQRDPNGLRPSIEARAFSAAARISAHADPRFQRIEFALPVTNSVRLVPGATETGTTVVTYLFFGPAAGLSPQRQQAEEYAHEYLAPTAGEFVGVTGAVPARLQQFESIRGALSLVEVSTVLVIALILALNFRAPVTPLMTLFSAGIGYLVTTRVVAQVGVLLDLAVPRELEPLILVLLLGIVTDYSIFFLSGFRQRLAEGEARLPAARAVTCDFVPIVATAGAIVAAGTAALVVGRLEFFQAFGPGMALTALVGLLVAITLVPALLAILGRSIFWPTLRNPGRRRPERTWGVTRFLSSSRPRAALVALATVAVLGTAASGLRDLRLGFTLIAGLPETAEAKQAADAASAGFAPGILAPTMAILEGPGIAHRRDALIRLEREIAAQRGVAAVFGPSLQPAGVPIGLFRAEGGNAARYIIVLDGEPGGGRAIEIFQGISRTVPRIVATSRLGAPRVSFAGDTALAAHTVERIVDDLERIAVAALLANLFFLVLFLRSLVAPLYLLAASVLALGASLGLATYVFQGLLGHEEITYYVPFAAAVLLVSLGSDYNIFVTGRVWNEARKRPLQEAVAVAAPRAARAIAIASVALAASFAVLAIVPLRPFREFAFIMSVGILIDSFLVRSLLVPSLIALVGESSTWPRKRLGGSPAEQLRGGAS